jgi:hypothetical protein
MSGARRTMTLGQRGRETSHVPQTSHLRATSQGQQAMSHLAMRLIPGPAGPARVRGAAAGSVCSAPLVAPGLQQPSCFRLLRSRSRRGRLPRTGHRPLTGRATGVWEAVIWPCRAPALCALGSQLLRCPYLAVILSFFLLYVGQYDRLLGARQRLSASRLGTSIHRSPCLSACSLEVGMTTTEGAEWPAACVHTADR